MATRKDQLDAFVFARRRMVANLVAPSPTGSDEAAPRPVKTFFTSAILSAVAVAGVAVLGVFKPSAPSGWESGLAVDNSSGAEYVYSPQDKQLHPVLNITSAKLLLGTGFKKFDVPDSVINGGQNVSIGAPIGILNAPPDVPTPGNVDLAQWTLCLDSASHTDQTKAGGKTILEVGYGAGADSQAPQSTAFVVHDSKNTNYVVTGDYKYPVEDNQVLNPLTSVSVNPGQTEGPWVSDAWLSAFRTGTPLQFPRVPSGLGDPLPAGSLPPQPGHHIGDYGSLPGVDGQQVGYIETADGLIEVNYFVYKLYAAAPGLSRSQAKPMENLSQSAVDAAQPRNELTSPSSLANAGTDWPQNSLTYVNALGTSASLGVLCVNFSGKYDGDLPHLSMYYGPQLPQPLPNGVTVQPNRHGYADYVLAKAGHGSLARDVSGGNSQNSGSVYLITDTGIRYLMTPTVTMPGTGGPNSKPTQTSAAAQLQYDKLDPTSLPDSWMRLIPKGADLDPSKAGVTPSLSGN